MDITIKDGYFEDPDRIRNLALSLDGWVASNKPKSLWPWRGERTPPLKEYNNPEFDKINQDIFDYVWEERNLSDWRYPNWTKDRDPQFSKIESENPIPNGPLKNPTIRSHFHISPLGIVNTLSDFWADRFHKDYFSCAGLIYLSPNPTPKSGTSILDAPNTQFINVENIYNRLVAYDGYNIHALTGCFGNTRENSRLTLVFFIHEVK